MCTSDFVMRVLAVPCAVDAHQPHMQGAAALCVCASEAEYLIQRRGDPPEIAWVKRSIPYPGAHGGYPLSLLGSTAGNGKHESRQRNAS